MANEVEDEIEKAPVEERTTTYYTSSQSTHVDLRHDRLLLQTGGICLSRSSSGSTLDGPDARVWAVVRLLQDGGGKLVQRLRRFRWTTVRDGARSQ